MAATEVKAKTLSADDILKANDLTVEPVDVPEWGGRVFVRVMSAGKRDEYEAGMRDDTDKVNFANFRARLVAFTCCDEQGNLLFAQAQVVQLANKSAVPVTTVFRAAQKLNKLGAEAVAAEKKDSAETPCEGSPTGSPCNPVPQATG